MSLKLSIIIPIYKVEEYIERCLLSCIQQKAYRIGEHYEIICVNDGTPDNSALIAASICKSHPGVKIINQENKGLSAARNTGLANSRGEYVWFIDSDDWIEPNALIHSIPMLIDNLDLLQIEYRYTYDDSSQNHEAKKNPINGIVTGIQQTIKGGLHTPAQFVIYRRQFLIQNKLIFREGFFHEDGEFRPRSLLLAKKVASIPYVCYNYYQRESGNIMSNFSEKNMKDLMIIMNELDILANKQDKEVRYALYDKLGSFMNTFLSHSIKSRQVSYKKIVQILNENKHLFNDLIKCRKKIYFIEFILFRININLGIYIYHHIKNR